MPPAEAIQVALSGHLTDEAGRRMASRAKGSWRHLYRFLTGYPCNPESQPEFWLLTVEAITCDVQAASALSWDFNQPLFERQGS